MKKTFITALCLFAMMHVNAQVVDNDFDAPVTTTTTTSQQSQYNSGTAFDIRFVEDGWGYGLTYIMKDLLSFGYFQDFYKSQQISDLVEISNRIDFGFHLGLNYRYWPTKFLYLEGQAGAGYMFASTSIRTKVPNLTSSNTIYYTTNYSSSTDGDFFVYFTPKIGVKIIEGSSTCWCLTFGYRWDAPKAKFGDTTCKGITLGFSGSF